MAKKETGRRAAPSGGKEGVIKIDLSTLPVPPSVGFADRIVLLDRNDHLELLFVDSLRNPEPEVRLRVVLDIVTLLISVLPSVREFFAPTLSWLEKVGADVNPPETAFSARVDVPAFRCGVVRTTRIGHESELEWYETPLIQLVAVRDKGGTLKPNALARVQIRTSALCGLLAVLLRDLPEYERRAQLAIANL